MEEKFDDDILSVQRQSPEATTIFAEGEKENTKVRARKVTTVIIISGSSLAFVFFVLNQLFRVEFILF